LVEFQQKLSGKLTLYVRQLAWLHATPKPDEKTKRAKTADPVKTLSRLDQMKRDGVVPAMPFNPAPHILSRLIEIGLTESNGMGATPLSWREINEWQRAMSIELAPWEARLIRRLSVEYLTEGRRAESENCPPPWRAEVTQRERDLEQARLEMLLG
jgi:hypothetical protein